MKLSAPLIARSEAKSDSPYEGLMMRSNANRAAIRIARRTFFIRGTGDGRSERRARSTSTNHSEKTQNRAIRGSEVGPSYDFYREGGRLDVEAYLTQRVLRQKLSGALFAPPEHCLER